MLPAGHDYGTKDSNQHAGRSDNRCEHLLSTSLCSPNFTISAACVPSSVIHLVAKEISHSLVATSVEMHGKYAKHNLSWTRLI